MESSRRTMVRGRQGGFTLVELVVVITILGVLAAVALPRFTNLQSDARAAKANALAGSIRAAAAQVKATALVRGVACTASSSSTVTLEGATISLAACYPVAPAADTSVELNKSIVAAANIDKTRDGVAVTVASNAVTLTIDGAATAATCSVTYTQPTVDNGAPTVAVETAGC